MTASFALDTPDLDQAHAFVASYVGPFDLTPCRRSGYRACVRGGRIGAFGIAEVSYRAAVDICSAASDDAFILELPVAGHCRASGSSCRRDAGPGDILAHRPGQIVLTRMHDASRLLVIRVPAESLPAGLKRLPSPLGAERLASVDRIARLFFEECAAARAFPRDEVVGAELQRMLLSLLGLCAGGDRPGVRDSAADELLPRSVRRAQALMMAAPWGGLTVDTLAERCGISVRTLQDNFRRFTGSSPSEWWRGYRLDRVHAALRDGRPGTGVTEAATAYGFFHLGRFAEHYRARFGEPPRETLRRARAGEG